MLGQGLDRPQVEEEPNTKVEEVVNSLDYNPEEDITSQAATEVTVDIGNQDPFALFF